MRSLLLTFRKNLSAQVFLTFTLLICLLSISFIVLFAYRQNTTLKSDWELNGKLLVRILAYQSRLGVFAENDKMLREETDTLLQQETVLVASLYNAGGELIAVGARKPQDVGLMPKEMPSNIKTVLDQGKNATFVLIEDLQVGVAAWAPVMAVSGLAGSDPLSPEFGAPREENAPLGYALVVLDKMPLRIQARKIFVSTVGMGAGFLVAGALATLFLARRISRPLKQLAQGIRKFGEEGVRAPLPIHAENEIGDLAAAFNTMADNLARWEADKEQLEQQLRRTQKMEAIGTLAGGIAHDFNNILGIISGYTELAGMDVPKESRARRFLQEIFIAEQRAKDLVQQILTFSRQGGDDPKPLQIGLAVKEVMKMLRATLPSTITIKYDVPRKLPAVIADPTQIHQVVMNLCTNAAHAMRENGGVLEVTLEEVMVDENQAALLSGVLPGRYQKLVVRDTGRGVPPDILERIFDPFFTTKQLGEGTGLGLSVVHGIVKKNNGAICVNSNLGEGTTFEIYFPSLEESSPESEEILHSLPTGTEHVLLVDDEVAMVEMGRQMLENLGYRVTAKSSSIEALAAFGADPGRFDLVVTDMTMPQMTGAALAQEILKLRPGMPIILCTGYSERIQEDSAKAMGIREFLLKPVILREFAAAIRRALA